MKYLLTFLLALNSPLALADDFTDESEVPMWAEDAVSIVKEAKIMTGFGDGSFRPWNEINRAEVVTLLFRAKGLEPEEAANAYNPFQDVPADSWFTNSVLTAAGKGWVKGKSDGQFHPAAPLNRAEFATLLTRVFEFDTENFEEIPEFKDIPSNAWFTPAVYAMYNRDLVRSRISPYYRPEKNVTRAEAAWVFSHIVTKAAFNGESVGTSGEAAENNARRVAIKPRDFNKFKQGFDIERKAINITAKNNGESINVYRDEEWYDLGSILLQNQLDEESRLNTLQFKLRFRQSSIGPAANFLGQLNVNGKIIEKQLSKSGEMLLTGMDIGIEPGETTEIFIRIKPLQDVFYYSNAGEGTFSVVDIKGINYAIANSENSRQGTIAQSSPTNFINRELSKVNFTPKNRADAEATP